MRWLSVLLSLICFSALADTQKEHDNLSQFDTPFLIGDWYLINPNTSSEEAENFLAIKLSLGSDYSFSIDIQKKDYSVDHWEGLYTADEETIVLGLQSDDPQIYSYMNNHNTLNLNGVTFTKGLSDALAGVWSSTAVSGAGMTASNINQVDLILQPDFVFMFRVENEQGEESVKQGVYYTEGENLILLYENGEQGTRYKLDENQLTLEDTSGDMYAVLNRVTR